MTLEGAVEARNERGIKLDGEWLNRSNFGPRLELPEVGTRIRAEVDNKGFLKSIVTLNETCAPASSSESHRLAVLQSAALFAAARTDIKSADVLTIAERWLSWVREDA